MGSINRRQQTFDLHLHSDRSDGRFGPDEVLERAAAGGLDVIALTDHDIVGGLDPTVHQVGGRTVRVLGGSEISGSHNGREFHLLVYFQGDPPAGFRDFCEAQVRARAVRYETAVQNIGLEGVPNAPSDALEGRLSLTRHHLARALVDAGHADDIGDAFARHAGHDNVPRLDTPFVDCIRIARSFGGVTSWAHPPVEAVRDFLPAFAEAGLHGLEGIRPGLRRHDRQVIKKAAKRHGLFLTGGSDWHGWHNAGSLGLFQIRGVELRGLLDALDAAA